MPMWPSGSENGSKTVFTLLARSRGDHDILHPSWYLIPGYPINLSSQPNARLISPKENQECPCLPETQTQILIQNCENIRTCAHAYARDNRLTTRLSHSLGQTEGKRPVLV